MNISQITKRDCEALRAALEERIEGSAIEERGIWLNTIRSTGVTRDIQGTWTIGDWFLVQGDDGVLLSRNSGRPREQSVGHVALVTKADGKWSVGEIRPKITHPRRN